MNTTFLFPSNAELNANWNSNELFPLQNLNFTHFNKYKIQTQKIIDKLPGRRSGEKHNWVRVGLVVAIGLLHLTRQEESLYHFAQSLAQTLSTLSGVCVDSTKSLFIYLFIYFISLGKQKHNWVGPKTKMTV